MQGDLRRKKFFVARGPAEYCVVKTGDALESEAKLRF